MARGDSRVTVLFDESGQVLKSLFPSVLVRLPRPAGLRLEPLRPLWAQRTGARSHALRFHPAAEAEAVLDMVFGNTSVALAGDEADEAIEAVVPLTRELIPRPPRQRLQELCAIGSKDSALVRASLRSDPDAELEPILSVACWHECVAFAFYEAGQMPEGLLPARRARVPDPAGKGFQKSRPLGVEGASTVVVALPGDPCA